MYWKYFCCNNSIRIAFKWHHSRISLCMSQTVTTQTAGARNKGGNFIGQLCISVVSHLGLLQPVSRKYTPYLTINLSQDFLCDGKEIVTIAYNKTCTHIGHMIVYTTSPGYPNLNVNNVYFGCIFQTQYCFTYFVWFLQVSKVMQPYQDFFWVNI